MSGGYAILACVAVCLALSLYAIERGRRADQERDRIEQKVDSVGQKVEKLREECECDRRIIGARLNQIDRKVAQLEAPDPFETILDREEDEE